MSIGLCVTQSRGLVCVGSFWSLRKKNSLSSNQFTDAPWMVWNTSGAPKGSIRGMPGVQGPAVRSLPVSTVTT